MVHWISLLLVVVTVNIAFAFFPKVQPARSLFRSKERVGISISLWASSSGSATTKGNKGKPGCKLCKGTGGVACLQCNGRGVDRVRGDVFQRWMCKACYGFGNVACSCTGAKGLTPEQDGTR